MTILTPQKLSIFNDSTPINAREKSKAYPYKISEYIELDASKHARVFDFIENKIHKVTEITKEQIESLNSKTMIEIELPDKNNILAFFNSSEYTTNDIDAIFYNVYHSMINKKIIKKAKEEIAEIEYTLNSKDFHWIWFRVGVSYLKPKVITRALSWIRMNPEIQFHLWTNLRDESYCEDFFSQIPRDDLAEFRARTTIHFKKEVIDSLREFCEHPMIDKLHILNFLTSVMTNVQDRASMIFKTDLFRAIILFLRGGWYSDFNDTYCLTSLKHIISPENPEMIYLGSDYTENIYNNYIIYAPQNSKLWLENVYKIIACSMNLYKILDVKDEEFASIVKAMIRSFVKILNESKNKNIFDSFIPRVPFWIKIINEHINRLFKKYNVIGVNNIELNLSNFIIFFKNILSKETPDSELVKRFNDEIGCIKSVGSVKGITLPVWSKNMETTYSISDYDYEFWSKYQITKTTIFNTLIDVTYPSFMHLNNIGRFFISMNVSHGVYLIPYCYVYENFCFLTALGHMGDGTCCGVNKTYEDKLL